jgi:hypothetical protein
VSCLLIKCCKYFVFCSSTLAVFTAVNTCVKHNFKSVHVSNLFWSREYNSAKEICKYPSISKVGGNYPLDLKIIWSSGHIRPLHSRSWILIIQNCFIIPVNRPGGLSYNKHTTSTVVHVLAMYDTFFPEKLCICNIPEMGSSHE